MPRTLDAALQNRLAQSRYSLSPEKDKGLSVSGGQGVANREESNSRQRESLQEFGEELRMARLALTKEIELWHVCVYTHVCICTCMHV
jgi:hypothetical protein